MSKLSLASANIRATALGGLRTGISAMRNTQPGPVTVVYGGGSNLPAPAPQGSHRDPVLSRTSLNGPYLHAAPAVAAAVRPVRQQRRAPVAAAKPPVRSPKREAPAKAAAVLLRKLPKGRFAGTFARNLCRKLAGGVEHTVKVVQAKADINGGPAFLVYLKLAGQSRGKHVATLYRNAYHDHG